MPDRKIDCLLKFEVDPGWQEECKTQEPSELLHSKCRDRGVLLGQRGVGYRFGGEESSRRHKDHEWSMCDWWARWRKREQESLK